MTDADSFRRAAGRFATGVTVVTARAADEVYGVTVSSFASLSLNPLLVTVSIRRGSPLLSLARAARHFGVSVLASSQQAVGAYFATSGRGPERGSFGTVVTFDQVTGAPLVRESVSWFDCELDDVLPGGDHEILIGRVVAAGGGVGQPLVYWAGSYRSLSNAADQSTDASGLADAADALSVALHLLDVGAVEMLDAQLALEPAICGLAATYGSTAQWEELETLIERSRAVVDSPDEFNALALATHDLIAQAAGNRVLGTALLSLRRVQSRHYLDLGSRGTADAAVEEHRAIVDALRAGDPILSTALMRTHLGLVRDRLLG